MKSKTVWIAAVLLLVLCGCGQEKETAKEAEAAVSEGTASAPEEKQTEEKGAVKTAASQRKAAKEEKENSPASKTNAEADKASAATDKKAEGSAPEKSPAKVKNGSDGGSKTAKTKAGQADGSKAAKDKKETELGKELPEYTVKAFAEAKTMFAADAVNVRKGPSTDFDRVGSLNRAAEVSVTGQADTGWYEIVFGEERAFVSGHYLKEEKPEEEPLPPAQEQAAQPAGQQEQKTDPAAPQGAPPAQPVTQVKNVAGVILVGDSRFVQMQANVGENSCTWIAESGKGYHWFNDNAVARIDGCVGKGSKILINLGVNDPGNLNNYLALVNAKASEWAAKGAVVYYASVNPVWENPYVTEEQVEYFNSQMQGGLSGDVHWIDSHSYLNGIGYKLVDGLHYNAETYQNLYAYFMSCL